MFGVVLLLRPYDNTHSIEVIPGLAEHCGEDQLKDLQADKCAAWSCSGEVKAK